MKARLPMPVPTRHHLAKAESAENVERIAPSITEIETEVDRLGISLTICRECAFTSLEADIRARRQEVVRCLILVCCIVDGEDRVGYAALQRGSSRFSHERAHE
jgi:hypothetical protein